MKKTLYVSAFLLVFPSFLSAQSSQDDYQMALNAYKAGQYHQCLAYCRKAVQSDPQSWQAYEVMAETYAHFEMSSQAVQAALQSLQIHPDNPPLKAFAVRLGATFPDSTPTPVSTPAETASKAGGESGAEGGAVSLFEYHMTDAKAWLKLNGSYAFGVLQDFNNAAAEWRNVLVNADHVDAGNTGYLVTAEMGLALDPVNGLALELDGGQYESLAVAGVAITQISGSPVTYNFQQDVTPTFAAAFLDYYRFWPGKDGRFFVKGGVGLGLANANVFEQAIFTGADSGDGHTKGPDDLSSLNVCFNGGLGYEWMLWEGFGLEVSGNGLYAPFSGLTGDVTVVNPSGTVLQTGTAGLYKGPKGRFELDYTDAVPTGSTPAGVDFSGFDVGLSVNTYFF